METPHRRARAHLSLALICVLAGAIGGTGCGSEKPTETEGHKRMRERQELIKRERALQSKLAEASEPDKTAVEAELAEVSAKLDAMDAENAAKQAERAAAAAEARKPENRIARDMKSTKLNCATAAQNVASLDDWSTERRRNYIDVCVANTMHGDASTRDAHREFYTCAQVAHSMEEIKSICGRFGP